jgi:hypothetical protein
MAIYESGALRVAVALMCKNYARIYLSVFAFGPLAELCCWTRTTSRGVSGIKRMECRPKGPEAFFYWPKTRLPGGGFEQAGRATV